MSAAPTTSPIARLLLAHAEGLGRAAAACERAAARDRSLAPIAAGEARRIRAEQLTIEAIAAGKGDSHVTH